MVLSWYTALCHYALPHIHWLAWIWMVWRGWRHQWGAIGSWWEFNRLRFLEKDSEFCSIALTFSQVHKMVLPRKLSPWNLGWQMQPRVGWHMWFSVWHRQAWPRWSISNLISLLKLGHINWYNFQFWARRSFRMFDNRSKDLDLYHN